MEISNPKLSADSNPLFYFMGLFKQPDSSNTTALDWREYPGGIGLFGNALGLPVGARSTTYEGSIGFGGGFGGGVGGGSGWIGGGAVGGPGWIGYCCYAIGGMAGFDDMSGFSGGISKLEKVRKNLLAFFQNKGILTDKQRQRLLSSLFDKA